MDEINLAYAAGFFDGEGCVIIHKGSRVRPGSQYPNCSLQCSIGQTDFPILEKFKSDFGGSIVRSNRTDTRPNRRPCWAWSVTGMQAVSFLKAIEPYLILKKSQAEVAIEFQNNKLGRQSRRSDKGTFLPLTDEERAIQDVQRMLLKSLKHGDRYEVSAVSC